MKFTEVQVETLRTDGVVLTQDMYMQLSTLPPEQRGRAAWALIQYGMTGDAETYEDQAVIGTLKTFARSIDRSVNRHLKAVSDGSKAAKDGGKGGRPTKAMQDIIQEWNSMADELGLPRQKAWTGSLIKTVKQLFADGETVETIVDTMHTIPDSEYLMGMTGRRIKAHFGWFLEHYEDVKSGKYNDGSYRQIIDKPF